LTEMEEQVTKQLRIAALALAGAIGLGILAPTAAHAGSTGRRNTAIALAAVGIYGIAKKNPLVAGLGMGGAAYSYASSLRARDKERRRARHRRYYRAHRHSRYCRH